MSSDVAIRVRDVTKHYVLFDRPEDRLKQMIVPRLQRLAGRPATRYFRPFAALNSVSLDVHRGETVGIVGRNGSGKSTLLQIICGTLQPTVGTVEVAGRIAALLELGSGFNPQFTGRENVFLYAAILGLTRAETERRFDDIARFADIGMFIDQPVKNYSSGMYVRLAFATAINVDPDILVVDEALAVGDEAFQRKCFARIENIKEKGGTILFVSHGAQTIVQLCDRALLMDGGEIILQGRPKLVVGQYQRLANASAENQTAIRVSIREDSVTTDRSAEDPVDTSKSEAPNADPAAPFSPDLLSQSMIFLEPQGARICSVKLKTISGEPANILQMGRKYVLTYSVDFDKPATSVGFIIQIRTVQGVIIGGCNTARARSASLKKVEAGTTVHARFEIPCSLLPGTYFVSCAVRGSTDKDTNLMHRAIDAVCFRVLPEIDLTATGLCDLNILPAVTVLANTNEKFRQE